ncbi:hypothetical protein JCM33374_g3276 [Metschnikowia sp. JCM 33374]|nr:hypothetical protein JCM33374_g3276 [Metschnikowia sp. JCM 33374]
MSKQGLSDFLSSLQEAAGGSSASPDNRTVKKQKTPTSLSDPSRLGKSSSFGYTEINKFEHCARSLQKSIRTIVDEAPTLAQLNGFTSDDSLDNFAKSEAKTNPLLRLVSKLKSLYLSSQLPIFDNILDNNLEVNEANLGPDPAPKKAKKPSKKEPKGEEFDQIKGLPPLPKIKNPELRSRVYQHKSTCANKTYLKEDEIVLTHNERIEFLGDSVMNTIVTIILYSKFPTANEGELSQIRSSLVSNKVLAEFAVAYGFDKKLRCNIDEEALKTGKQKVFADVFEAYVGALVMERGYDLKEVEDWLSALMANKMAIAGKEHKKMPINKEAKTDLYSLIGTAALHPVYKVTENGNGINAPFKVQCLMEDVVLGEGEAPSLKDAGLRAAMSALKNKAMLEKYGRRRLETDRTISEIKPTDNNNNGNGSSGAESGTQFPLVADKSVLPNKFAKNEAYAYFGKNLGITPEYKIEFEEENNRYKVELRIKEVAVSVAYDASKKNAMSRAASVVLENKHLLNDIVSLVN